MVGKTLGHYQVLEKIGAGGMGEVYRARDMRLGRDVAIKALPPAFAQNPERLARFEREAQLLAALNHPNIAAIYGLEPSDGSPVLVLELVEGPTLAERISSGPMDLDDAIGVARQICEALEVAHEKGIVHRDLKPANVKITPEGKVKVLDFGLAKAFNEDPTATDYARSPTISLAATRAGVILGTAAYMSPEQARGRQVDRRTDVWAFGCVLYEMLTGRQVFGGTDVTDVIAAIVRSEPDWDALPASTPPRLRELLRRCIQKDPIRRLRDIGDVRLELDEAFAAPVSLITPVAPSPARPRRILVPLLAASLLSAVAAGVAVWVGKPAPRVAPREPKRLTVSLPPEEGLLIGVALSPDGSRLVYSGVRSAQGRQLYLRPMDQLETKPIRGTENGLAPSFSPDGQWVVFVSSGQLRKVSVSGGTSQALAAVAQGRGTSWGADDKVIFGAAGGGLMRVSSGGGTPEPVTKLETQKGERGHHWPFILPGGKGVLFSIATGGGGDTDRIAVKVFATGEQRILVEGGSNPRYGGGYLVFVRAGTLLAAPFDIDQLKLTATPVPVAEGIGGRASTGAAYYATADDGTLAYVQGGFGQKYSLVWVDRKGSSRTVPAAPGFFHDLRLSPDGKRLALNVTTDARSDLWVYDLVRDTLTRLTFDGAHSHAWHPDGKRVAYGSMSGVAGTGLLWKASDGSSPEEKLVDTQSTVSPTSWSPDGRVLAFNESNADTRLDIMLLRPEGDRKPQPFLKTQFDEGGAMFSPGAEPRYIAYQSNETGRYEVYVQPFPGPGGKWQLSTDGGVEPAWASSGRELFYRSGERVMAVDVQTRPTFSASRPKLLFEGRYLLGRGLYPYWDVAPDGQRFLMIKSEDDAGQAQLHVVVDWFEELRRRVPVGRK